MRILAIETSCDDTAVAVIEGEKKLKILSNIISSQVKLHAKYGGVYPFLARREHQKNLPVVFEKAMKVAKNPEIDAVAVTYGPGLEPCLWVGLNFAKELAKKLNIPLFPVNHVEAHILANFIDKNPASIKFPAVCLVVSGGHTQLILMNPHTKRAHFKNRAERSAHYGVGVENFLEYEVLGETRDDAAGECFDKVARILGLGYPGGPIISKLAKGAKTSPIKLPRPMINQKNYDFSFSGLKTAVLYEFRKESPKTQQSQKYIKAMCAEVQQAIIDVLVSKTKKAVQDFEARTVILGGGVAANDELRKQFKKSFNAIVPEKDFCTDNAVMTALTAYFHMQKGDKPQKNIEARADLTL